MIKNFLIWVASATCLLAAEPSAFSAGDLSVEHPYGLTENEKLLLKNIDNIKDLNRDKNTLKSQTEILTDELAGIRTLIEGLNGANQKTQIVLKKILVSIDDLEVQSVAHKSTLTAQDGNITQLKLELEALVNLQKQNYEKIEERFIRMEEQTVSKSEFDAFKTVIADEFKRLNKSVSPVKEKKKSSAALYKEGRDALRAKAYQKALDAYAQTIAKNYKPASSHFYTGEAYFYLKEYTKAASFYKESYKRYKNGKYNDALFLHMAISLDKTGQKKAAKKFFQLVVSKYPHSTYAKEAQKYLP